MDTSKLKTFSMFLALLCGKIPAIKEIKNVLELSLKEAKDLADNLFYSVRPANLDFTKVVNFFGIKMDNQIWLNQVIQYIARGQSMPGDVSTSAGVELVLGASLERTKAALRDVQRENQDLKDRLSDPGEVEEMQETIKAQDIKIAKMEKIISILLD